MRLLLDAQLPRVLCRALNRSGHDAVHTLDLAEGNHTADGLIANLADQQERIVVSKDFDFVVSHLLHGRPAKLLQVSTGNISNLDLESLLFKNIDAIENAFSTANHVEITRASLIIHG